MAKILFMGDFQTYSKQNAYGSGSNTLENSLKALDRVFEIASENGVKTIYCTGDFFEHSKPTPYEIQEVADRFTCYRIKYSDIVFNTITGNHDWPQGVPVGTNADQFTAIGLLASTEDNFFVVDHLDDSLESLETKIFCLPFMRNEADFFTALEGLKEGSIQSGGSEDVILVMHQDTKQEIRGSKIDESSNLFKPFKLVINGHIHRGKQNGNFLTIGSLCQMKAGDKTIVAKGVHIYDEETRSTSFIEVESPVFVDYYYGDVVAEEDAKSYINWKVKPVIEGKKKLNLLDDSTQKGKVKASQNFVNEKFPDAEEDLEEEISKLLPRVKDAIKPETKSINYLWMELEGFRTWLGPVRYELNTTTLTYIQAPKGSGKSSIFEALYWALYGELLKEKAKQEDITPEAWLGENKGTKVSVALEINNVVYKVVRCLNYKGNVEGVRGKSDFHLFKQEGENWTPLKAEDIDCNEDDFGMKLAKTKAWASFCKIDSKDFINSVLFTPEKCQLIQASDADKRVMLEPILGVSWVDELKELAKAERIQVEVEVGKLNLSASGLEGKMLGLEGSLNEIPNRKELFSIKKAEEKEVLLSNLSENETELIASEKEVYVKTQEIDTLKNSLDTEAEQNRKVLTDKLETTRKTAFSLYENISKLSAERDSKIIEHKQDRAATNLKLENLNFDRANLENIIEERAKLVQKLSNELLDCKVEPTDKLGLWENELIKFEEAKKIKLDVLVGVKSEISQLSNEKSNLKLTISSGEGEIEHKTLDCPVCARALPEGHNILEELAKFKETIEDARRHLKTVLGKISIQEANSKLVTEQLEELAKEIEKCNEQIAAEQDSINNLWKSEKKEFEVKIENAKTKKSEAEAVLVSHLEKIKEVKKEFEEIEKAEEKELSHWRVKHNTKIVVEQEKADNFKEEQINPLEKELENLGNILEANRKLSKEIAEAQNIVDEEKDFVKEASQVITNQREKLKELETRQFDESPWNNVKVSLKETHRERKELQILIDQQEKRATTLLQIEQKVCSAKGLKSDLIRKKLSKVNQYAAVYAEALGTSINFWLDDSNNSYRCDIMVEGRPRDARKASTGQLVIANLIFVGALKDLRSEEVKINLQILDEPFSNLDADAAFQVSQLLVNQAARKAVHVITHAQTLDMTNSKILHISGGEKTASKFI